jgi:cytochrome oxidase assembly protein ShyY1
MPQYLFLSKPKWIAFLAIGLAGLIGMPVLAGWQWRRYSMVTSLSSQIKDRQSAVATPLELVLDQTATLAKPGDVEWRNVVATGSFDAARQVLVRNRSQNNQPGFHVVTPLKLDRGGAILVSRGFIGLSPDPGTLPAIPPPTPGTVEVTGRIRLTQKRGTIGAKDPQSGTLTTVNRVDIERIAQQSPYPLQPVYLEFTAQQPPADVSALDPIPLPVPDDGSSNISYMVQWISFTIAGVVTWWMIIRRHANKAPAKGHAVSLP